MEIIIKSHKRNISESGRAAMAASAVRLNAATAQKRIEATEAKYAADPVRLKRVRYMREYMRRRRGR